MRTEIGPLITADSVTMWSRAGDKQNWEVRDILEKSGIPFTEVHVDKESEQKYLETFRNYTGYKNYPFIYFGIRAIGGLKELKKHEQSGELEKLIKEHNFSSKT